MKSEFDVDVRAPRGPSAYDMETVSSMALVYDRRQHSIQSAPAVWMTSPPRAWGPWIQRREPRKGVRGGSDAAPDGLTAATNVSSLASARRGAPVGQSARNADALSQGVTLLRTLPGIHRSRRLNA